MASIKTIALKASTQNVCSGNLIMKWLQINKMPLKPQHYEMHF